MKTSTLKFSSTVGFLLYLFFANPNVVVADQQQWSSQYIKWQTDYAEPVLNVSQDIWIPVLNNNSYWTLNWNWKGYSGIGGYLGLQQEASSSTQQARFSLWSSDAARGDNCRRFSGEGNGFTCVIPVKIKQDTFYRLRIAKIKADENGQWWEGWLVENLNGLLVERSIGQIRVVPQWDFISPNSISSFSEYFGTAVSHCNEVPFSAAGFAPPAFNYIGHGQNSGHTKYDGFKIAPDNICKTGQESQGAFVTATPYNFGFANGVMLLLGGQDKHATLNPAIHPTPPQLPYVD